MKNGKERKLVSQNFVTLNNGCSIPQLGLGVFMISEDENARTACLEAFRIGYRHIDTAHHYHNERGVGRAVRESGIDRSELWITSKLWPNEYGEDVSEAAIDRMLKRLDTDYLDLLLLHQQVGDYLGGWRSLERAVAQGKVRSIGLSNFESERLENVLAIAAIPPAVIQVECHPYFQQEALKERVAAAGTRMECWFPIGHGSPELLNEPAFVEMARKYAKSTVQVILRWHMQVGNIAIPKSTNPLHLRENLDIFDFELTDEEMSAIRAMDNGVRFYVRSLKEQEERFLAIALDD